MDITREAFNARQAADLTAVTHRQLIHWDSRGVVKPSVGSASGRGSRRLYSYKDLLALKTVGNLREQGVSLQKIRRCVQYLRQNLPDISEPLVFCSLITDGATVYLIVDEETLVDTVKQQGQRAFLQLSIAAIDRELRKRVLTLSRKHVEDVTVGDSAYQVEIEADLESGGYVAEVAGLPGCITQGETIAEVMENVHDAVQVYLEAVDDLAARGVRLPIRKSPRRRAAGA